MTTQTQDKKIVVMPNTYKEIKKIFERYQKQYGNITLGELITKFGEDVLILN